MNAERLLAHYEQMPLAEIAQVLDIQLGAAKSRLQRARASLKETLAAYAPGIQTGRGGFRTCDGDSLGR